MQEMFSKLSSYAALLGVIGAIGGGFMAWGEFNNRIAQLENKEFVVNETVDLSGVNQKIEDVIKAIEGVKADIKINDAAIKFLDAKIEELKAEQDNPLLN
jgi:nitrate/TMAO reductase-like tetraheme cytochrome c subunit